MRTHVASPHSPNLLPHLVRGAVKIQFGADRRLLRIEQCFDLNTFMDKWRTLCATTAPESNLLSLNTLPPDTGSRTLSDPKDATEEIAKSQPVLTSG